MSQEHPQDSNPSPSDEEQDSENVLDRLKKKYKKD